MWFNFCKSKKVRDVSFNSKDILKILRTLNVNKTCRHGIMPIRISKPCDDFRIFKLFICDCMNSNLFPSPSEKANIVATLLHIWSLKSSNSNSRNNLFYKNNLTLNLEIQYKFTDLPLP